MAEAVVIVQAPCLAIGVGDIFEVRDARIVIPDLTTAPGPDIKDMIEGSFYYAAMADSNYAIVSILFHQTLNYQSNSRSEMNEGLAILDKGRNR